MRVNVLKFLRMSVLQFVNYGLTAISFRMLARGSYLGIAITDALLSFWAFTMYKKILLAETHWEQAGYTVGGILGSLFALWITS